MTAGFHSPLPPARTGVAEYSAALLKALARRGRVVPGAQSADVHLYHLGNNQLHAGTYARSLEAPGVVVLHDAVLHHFHLGFLSREEYVEEFVYNYGEWMRGVAAGLWQERSRSGADPRYFSYPMVRRAAERSRAVVVHNAAAAAAVVSHCPAARVVVIPHFFDPPPAPDPAEVEKLRREMVPQGQVLAGVFGHLRESKRVLPLLRTAARLQPRIRVLLAGDFASADLERAAAPYLEEGWVVRVGYTPEEKLWLLGHAVDLCVNLRYPAAGETSGISIRLMGIGRPVLVTDSRETADVPEGCCIRIPPGIAEEGALEAALRWAIASPSERKELGAMAARHMREANSLEAAADLYWQTLRECSG